MSNAIPSIDPSDLHTLTGMLRNIVGKAIQGMDCMLPAQVISFDRNDPNRVQVQPLIMQIDTNGQTVSRGQIASIPVLQLGAGGAFINFNLKTGDLGWIKSNDRDISIFLQSYSESGPQTFRKKDFSDSVFIPDVMRGYTIDEEDAENMVIGTVDGNVKISIGTEKIKIKAPTVEIESENIELNASSGILATTPLFRVVGEINASGNITPNVP